MHNQGARLARRRVQDTWRSKRSRNSQEKKDETERAGTAARRESQQVSGSVRIDGPVLRLKQSTFCVFLHNAAHAEVGTELSACKTGTESHQHAVPEHYAISMQHWSRKPSACSTGTQHYQHEVLKLNPISMQYHNHQHAVLEPDAISMQY